jgi:hypothetical protein
MFSSQFYRSGYSELLNMKEWLLRFLLKDSSNSLSVQKSLFYMEYYTVIQKKLCHNTTGVRRALYEICLDQGV